MPNALASRLTQPIRAAMTTDDEVITGDIAIRVYSDLIAFEEDAIAFASIGFFPVTVTNQPQRAGAVRIVLLNFLALLWQPAPHLIVTYQRRA